MMYIFTSVLNYIKIYRKINTIIKSTNYSIEGLNNINESYIIELYDDHKTKWMCMYKIFSMVVTYN